MKIRLLLFIFFTTNLFFSQENIVVHYDVVISNEESLFKNNQTLRYFFDNAIKNADKLKFKLICTPSTSKFYDVSDYIDLDFSHKQTLLSFTSYGGVVFQEKNYIYKQAQILSQDIYVKKTVKQDWVLHNETKIINGFICYKATSINKIIYGEKVFNHPITAWYSPSIPFHYGPNGYSGLPGLILELQVRNVVFGVTKIEFDTIIKLIFEKDRIKILNEKEYNEKLNKFNDFDE